MKNIENKRRQGLLWSDGQKLSPLSLKKKTRKGMLKVKLNPHQRKQTENLLRFVEFHFRMLELLLYMFDVDEKKHGEVRSPCSG